MAGRRSRWLAVFVVAECLVAVLVYVGPRWSLGGMRFGRGDRAVATVDTGGAPPVGDPTATAADEPTTTAADVATTTVVEAATTTTTDPAATTSTTAPAGPAGPASHTAGWVVAENARPGTDAWKIGPHDPLDWIEGYARSTSVHPGEQLPIYVDTGSGSFTVEAYRMGFYGGKQGRLVWTSLPQVAVRQPAAVVDDQTGMAEARWSVSLVVPVGPDWPPGSYLLKLVTSTAASSYVPVTVRDDEAVADVLVMSAVTTWQAYNPWGGCSLYRCHGSQGRDRAVKVSFDRPYARTYKDGSADFLDHELPLVALVEELGIDAAYATNLDVHGSPGLTARYRAAVSLGHDEYYSRAMRTSLVEARAAGVNLAFFGANAVYRHVRFEAAGDGRADRVMVNYRSAPDPGAATNPAEATREWRTQGAPEAELVGIQYVCAGVAADLVVASARHWVWAGAGVRDGQALRHLVGNEADAVTSGASPTNIDRLAVSPLRCGTTRAMGHASYYSAPSGAGVFASGTIWWVCALEAQYCSEAANVTPVRAATGNVLRVFAEGPAGRRYPSGQPGT